jgi:beta-N-acetylhexosaminidase
MTPPVADTLQLAGSVVMGALDGPCLDDHGRELLEKWHLGGLTLFARNVESAEQVRDLTAEIAAVARSDPPLIAIDQEGGRVARLRAPFLELPPMLRLAEAGADESLFERAGTAVGLELRAVGVNVDFAPVLDVHSNPQNPVIGDRAFGTDPEQVAALALAFARGLMASGVMACGKHFPGHGDTLLDSHKALPRLPHGMTRLRAVELPPFVAAVRAGLPSLMTAHVVYEGIDPRHPATLSPALMDGLLRHELKYDGVVFTDDLEMAAVTDRWSIGAAAVQSLAAGADMPMVCRSFDRIVEAIEAIVRAVESGRLARARLEAAAQRVEVLRARILTAPAAGDLTVVGCDAHRALAEHARGLVGVAVAGESETLADPTARALV